jgi:hypothetical protein
LLPPRLLALYATLPLLFYNGQANRMKSGQWRSGRNNRRRRRVGGQWRHQCEGGNQAAAAAWRGASAWRHRAISSAHRIGIAAA